MTDRGPGPRCPANHSTLEPVEVDEGIVFTCRACQGIWLPAEVVQVFSLRFKAGWTGYVPFEQGVRSTGTCPAGHGTLQAFHYWIYRIELCAECGAVWLPGELLQELDDRARRNSGIDKAIHPWAPESYLLGPAAVAVGVHPEVVQTLLTESSSVWVR